MKRGSSLIIGFCILIGSFILAFGNVLGHVMPVYGSCTWDNMIDDYKHKKDISKEDITIQGFYKV